MLKDAHLESGSLHTVTAKACGALAIVYDHHYYPMNGPDDDRHSEEGFAKDLCCAFARIRWLRDLVAWLRAWRWRPFAERAIAITMYCTGMHGTKSMRNQERR